MIFREVNARLFPWGFVDEDPDDILDTLERDALVNSFYPVILMHDEKRPLSEFYYAHNPRRKVYWTEDSRATWHFDPSYYAESRITPPTSEDPELAGTDWVQFSVDRSAELTAKPGPAAGDEGRRRAVAHLGRQGAPQDRIFRLPAARHPWQRLPDAPVR